MRVPGAMVKTVHGELDTFGLDTPQDGNLRVGKLTAPNTARIKRPLGWLRHDGEQVRNAGGVHDVVEALERFGPVTQWLIVGQPVRVLVNSNEEPRRA